MPCIYVFYTKPDSLGDGTFKTTYGDGALKSLKPPILGKCHISNFQTERGREEVIDRIESKADFTVLSPNTQFLNDKRNILQRRIGSYSYKYFFHPIYDTPFSLGIALPMDYGIYEVIAEEEVKLSSVNGKCRLINLLRIVAPIIRSILNLFSQ